MNHQIFVYFKTPVAVRDVVSEQIQPFASEVGAGLANRIECSRRHPDNTGAELDTWLEHYQCRNLEDARALLAKLAQPGASQSLIQLIPDGLSGRHIEHFLCV